MKEDKKGVQEVGVSVFLYLFSFHFAANRGRVGSYVQVESCDLPIILSMLNVYTFQAAASGSSYRRIILSDHHRWSLRYRLVYRADCGNSATYPVRALE